MKTKPISIAIHLWHHAIPSLFGILKGKASIALIRERIRFMLFRKVRPIVERGFLISDIQSIVAWWEIVVEDRLLSAVPFTPNRILDIGGNYGIFGYAASLKWPHAKLDAFEPHPRWATYVKQTGVYDTVWNCALGKDCNPVFLHLVANEGATATTNPNLYSVQSNPIEVECRTLDSLAVPQPDLIKIDVDGAEVAVLEGGIKTMLQAKAILVEINCDAAMAAYRSAFKSPEWDCKKITPLDVLFVRNVK